MKETNIKIKRTWDIERLTALRMEALEHAGISSENTIKFTRMTNQYYKRYLADGSLISCIATDDDGNILGCGDLRIHDSLPTAATDRGKSAFITNIYVRPGYNTPASAESIFQWLSTEAMSHGADKVSAV